MKIAVRNLIILFAYVFSGFSIAQTSNLPSNCLFFECSCQADAIPGKKVFAHYFTPFPLSIDNKDSGSDYYTKNYLAPSGENGKFSYAGGFIKQRPLPRAVINSSKWPDLDAETEIRKAVAIGLDGFSVDILSSEGVHWDRTKRMLDSAKIVDPNFKILLMPDMEAEFKAKPEKLIFVIRSLASHPSVHKLEDGRVVVAPYNAQNQSAVWWQALIAQLQYEGIKIALFPVFQGWQTYAKDFSKISYGMSDWGDRSPGVNAAWRGTPKIAANYGVKWMAPVSPQDARPKSLLYTEAKNSLNYRTMWENAILGDADWVQVITWNDYSESTEIAPSTGTGTAFAELTAYYISWFKTGIKPAIVKDALYYFHRNHSIKSVPNPQKQPKVYSVSAGSDAPNDEIEVLTFLTKPTTLEITIGTTKQTKQLLAGMSSTRVPVAQGRPQFALRRGSSIVMDLISNTTIQSTIDYQDFLYRAGGVITVD